MGQQHGGSVRTWATDLIWLSPGSVTGELCDSGQGPHITLFLSCFVHKALHAWLLWELKEVMIVNLALNKMPDTEGVPYDFSINIVTWAISIFLCDTVIVKKYIKR